MALAFDDAASKALLNALTLVADDLQRRGFARRSAVEDAVEQFEGGYANLFTECAQIEAADRGRLAGVLFALGDAVAVSSARAAEERARRDDVAQWTEREERRERTRATDTSGLAAAGTLVESVFDPKPSDDPVTCPAVSAEFSARERPRSVSGPHSHGKTSADPERLRAFVTSQTAANTALDGQLTLLQRAWTRYTTSCSWVPLGSVTFLAGFQRLLEESRKDVTWTGTIAAAFEAAGGAGGLSNAVLNKAGTLSTLSNLKGPAALMGLLKTLAPEELAELVRVDPGLVQSFWDHAPDSAQVAAWWTGMNPAEQAKWCAAAPAVIGNLGGIPYSTRAQVNLAEFRKLSDAQLCLALTDKQRRTIEQIREVLQKGGNPQLVDFNFWDENPKVAVAYGDLDTADSVTMMAPGMGFNADAATGDWSQAAQNLRSAQKAIGGPGEYAVVAWLGYDAPDPIGVLGPGAAQRGSVRLTSELDAIHDTRAAGAKGLPSVAVVAHSYGTTVSADALTNTKYRVDSFVMVGSAGLDSYQIDAVDDLHVRGVMVPGQGMRQAVYTTNAALDGLAPFGAQASGRLQPNPGFVTPGQEGVFGMQSFGSDGNPAAGLTDVRGHNPIGKGRQAEGAGNASPPVGHGYLDERTQSIYNVAAASVGLPERIDGGTTWTTPSMEAVR